MKLSELLSAIPVLEMKADSQLEISGVSSDSRKIKEGFAFVCLKGLKQNGLDYLPSAMEKGAVLAICEDIPAEKIPYVLVEDARGILPLLLSNFYQHPQLSFRHVIGITGTNGKTTTSFMLKSIMEAAGRKTGLIGTTKYLIGDEEYPTDPKAPLLTTPDPELLFALFDAMRNAGVDTVIMETSSHALALKKLNSVPFHVGIFTNLTRDHIDFHKTMEEYLEAKKSLFQVAKVGIFNQDDPAFSQITKNVSADVIAFSANEMADYTIVKMGEHTPLGISFTVGTPVGEIPVEIPMPGRFTVYNALGAIAASLQCGVSPEAVQLGLSRLSGVKGRIERVPTKTDYSVFIDFAHTPDALENILNTLREFTKGRLITLFGCGGDRDKTKRPIMGKIACELSDLVVVTSDNSRTEKKEDIIRDILVGVEGSSTEYHVIVNRREAILHVLEIAQKDDVILLAGKGHEEYEIDETGKHPFSEKNIVLETVGE